MPNCRPFKGWLYNTKKILLNEVLAPPYDVVTSEEIKSYKEKSPYNIFHLELPETLEKGKELLESFIKEEIFFQNGSPALYYHEVLFNYEGESYLRKGLILAVRLHNFEEGIILPHEKIYPKVVEDRFQLLKTMGFQFSQIFGLYEDPDLYSLKILEEKGLFYGEASLNGEVQRLFKIQDEAVIKEILKFLEGKKIYIADGHHRYLTALKYRDYLRDCKKNLKTDNYEYIVMYLCPFEDRNLLMLPTHRFYRFSLEELRQFNSRLPEWVTLEGRFSFLNFKYFKEKYEGRADVFSLWDGRELSIYALKPERFEFLRRLFPELSSLPLFNFLQILKDILKVEEVELMGKKKVFYFSCQEKFLKKDFSSELAIFFPKVSSAVLKRIVSAGKLMPQKSTYFYPKILTGFVLYQVKE